MGKVIEKYIQIKNQHIKIITVLKALYINGLIFETFEVLLDRNKLNKRIKRNNITIQLIKYVTRCPKDILDKRIQ